MRDAVKPADSLDLTAVIPALREAANLAVLLPQLRDALDMVTHRWEILVVDANSQDGTEEVVAGCGAGVRYVCEEKRGYGEAILRGVAEARGAYVLTLDADLSHPVEFVQRLWRAREAGEIVIGSRYAPGGGADQPWARYQLSKLLNRFFRYGLGVPVRDMSSGYRLYKRSLFSQIEIEHRSFVFLVELLLKAYGAGFRIQEVPFHYQPRVEGTSNARILRFGINYLRLFRAMWRVRNSVEFSDYDWRAYDSRIPLQRYWQRKRHHHVARLTPPFVRTCDVGCGTSRILADMPHAVGVDLRRDRLRFMRRTNTRLVQGDGLRLPFPDNTFECVISSQVIEHIPDEKGAHLDELARVLKPGGTLIVGTPDYGGWQWPVIEWFYGRLAPGAYADEHCNPYARASLTQALEARNCRVREVAYILKAEMIVHAVKQDGDR